MIGKIRKGRSFAGLARYLYGPGKREEHVDPRTVAGDHILLGNPRSWRDWAADMTFYAQTRPDVARPVWHCSLRTAPEDPVLDDARWAAIAAQHIEAMGLADYPWVAVRHGPDHVHIVACRIDLAGRVWRDSHDYARSMRSCRQIEVDYGLTVVDARRRTGRYATTTAAERARADRRGVEPERARLRDLMHAARTAAAGAGVAGWERELAARGVLYEAKTTRDGTVIGYRVSLPGWIDAQGEQVWLKASQVDRRLSWARIRPDLECATSRRPPAREAQDRARPTAAQLAAQAFAAPPGPGHRPPAPRRPLGPSRLAALDQSPQRPHRRRDRLMPLPALARLANVLRAGSCDEDTVAALCLLYALARLAEALADLHEAHDRLHRARAARLAAARQSAWAPPATGPGTASDRGWPARDPYARPAPVPPAPRRGQQR